MTTPLERLVGPLPSAPVDFRDHADMVSQAIFDASKRDLDAFVRVLEEEPTLLESGTVVYALGAVEDARLIPLLVGVLESADSHVRWSAAHALEKRRDPRVIDAFIDALRDRAPTVRAVVIEALGEFADARALPALREALSRPSNHNDDYLRKLLEAAIERVK